MAVRGGDLGGTVALVVRAAPLPLFVLIVACGVPAGPPRVPVASLAPARAHPGLPRAAPPAAPVAPVFAPFPEVSPFRLPHTFEPSRYRAQLAINDRDRQFGGHIEIEGQLTEEVTLFWLHGVDLVVTHATATRGDVVVPLEFSPPRADQLLGFRSSSPLGVGQWTLSIDYSGRIRQLDEPQNKLLGVSDAPGFGVFFRRVVGSLSYVYTQSEPIYARRIFPCIDEPDRKVPWQLSLDVSKDLVAASNTAIVRETALDKRRKRVEFAETRPLPSYLIAFAVGPFDVVTASTSKSGTPIRILALHGRGASVAAAANVTPRILDLLESWLEIPYPYGKLDLVSVPRLGLRAMENPGLVTVDERTLESSEAARTIGHELAHQWFGNLVTPAWWNDIWLNESFARLMEDKVDARLASGSTALPDDARDSRLHAVRLLSQYARVQPHVVSNDDLQFRRFTASESIDRGHALLTIIEAHLGPERFWKAIRRYLAAHAHSTVVTANLIGAFSKVAPAPIDRTLTKLLDSSLSPLKVKLNCSGRARLQFSDVPGPVPVCVAYERNGKRAETCKTIDATSREVVLPGTSCPRWVMPNAGGTGLYHIKWTKPLVRDLLAHGWTSLSPPEHATLFDEIGDEALTLSVFVKLADGKLETPNEVSYLLSIAKYIPDDLRPTFDAWIVARYGTRARDLHFKSREVGEVARRNESAIVELVALTQDPQLAAEATQLAAHYSKPSDDDLFAVPLLALAANADTKIRDSLLKDLSNPKATHSQRHLAVEALARVRNIVGLLKAAPGKLDAITRHERVRLFANVCTSNDRNDLAEMLEDAEKDQFGGLLPQVDQCSATRTLLEPELRRWLGPTK